MSSPLNDGLLVHYFVVSCKTSNFLLPIHYASILRKFRRLLQNDAMIIPMINCDPKAAADLRKRFPNIESIRVIFINVELPPLRKMFDWTRKLLDDRFNEVTQSSDDDFINANKPMFHELLKTAHLLDVPEMVELLSDYAERYGIRYNIKTPIPINIGSLLKLREDYDYDYA